MNREIRFRAWDEVGRQWIYLTLADLVTNQLERQGFSTLRVANWCRFTGLTDKNGVEIYEGDILSLKRCPERHFGCTCLKIPDPKFTGAVVYEDRGFTCNEVSSNWSLYEVIGNIYENPELLGDMK